MKISTLVLVFAWFWGLQVLAQSNAPTNLAVGGRASTKIQFNWRDNSTNELGFDLESSRDGRTFNKVADVNPGNSTGNLNYILEGLTPNTTYFFRVKARFSTFTSNPSNVIEASTTAGPSPGPTNLVATATGTTTIRVTWTASGKEPSMELERKQGQQGRWSKITDLTVSEYEDRNLSPGTEYCYRVRYLESLEPSSYSNEYCATTQQASPAMPARLNVQATAYDKISISWADLSTNETGFELEVANSKTGQFSRIATLRENTTSYEHTNLSGSTQYCYRIRAINGSLASEFTEALCATTPAAPVVPVAPTTPARLDVKAIAYDKILISWADVSSNETGFELEVASSKTGQFSRIATLKENTTNYEHTNLSGSTQYCYRIRAVNNNLFSDFTEALCATTPAAPVPQPTPPTNLTAVAVSANQINLTWTDNATNETGFEIEESTDNQQFKVIESVGPNAFSYQRTGLTPATRYFYRVRAVNSGGKSDPTNTATATTPDVAPKPPINLTATSPAYNLVNLSWTDMSGNEKGFEIEISTDGAKYAKAGKVDENKTTYQVTDLNGSTTYYFRVLAVNDIGSSGYSNVVPITTAPAPVPDNPANLRATPLDFDLIRLTWDKLSPNATGVVVERSTSPTTGFKQIGTQNTPTTSFDDREILDIGTYYYRIKATGRLGDSQYSNIAKVDSLINSTAEPQVKLNVYVRNQTLFVQSPKEGPVAIQVLGLNGQVQWKVTTQLVTAVPYQHSISDLLRGVYVVIVESEKQRLVQKILLN